MKEAPGYLMKERKRDTFMLPREVATCKGIPDDFGCEDAPPAQGGGGPEG